MRTPAVEPRHLKALLAHLSGLGISVSIPAARPRGRGRLDGRKTGHRDGHQEGRGQEGAGEEGRGQVGRGARRQEGPGQEGRGQEGDRHQEGRPPQADAAPWSAPTARRSCPTCPTSSSRRTSPPTRPSRRTRRRPLASSSPTRDDTGEPEQQVMVAGATADPVKDYLKQIGKVPLLNAEMEVELAKRIEAGLFSRRSSPRAARSAPSCSRSWSGSPRTAAAPRTTCSRPTCGSSSRWPSATPAAACSSST